MLRPGHEAGRRAGARAAGAREARHRARTSTRARSSSSTSSRRRRAARSAASSSREPRHRVGVRPRRPAGRRDLADVRRGGRCRGGRRPAGRGTASRGGGGQTAARRLRLETPFLGPPGGGLRGSVLLDGRGRGRDDLLFAGRVGVLAEVLNAADLAASTSSEASTNEIARGGRGAAFHMGWRLGASASLPA